MRKIYSSKKECNAAWYQQNREKKDAQRRHFMETHPGYVRNASLKFRYGITQLDYDRFYQVQSGRCKICKRHQSELKTSLCVDHNHITGKIRGLLCRRCNLVLGVYENNKLDFSNYLEGN